MTNFDYTRKVYNRFSKFYITKRNNKEKSFFNNYLSDYQLKKHLKPVIKNKVTLDLGCGHGNFTNELRKLGAEVSGIDFSEAMISTAMKKYPELPFFTANAQETPFKKNTFDIIASNLVLHYFKDLKPVFKEISRILKPKGILIFSIHHPVNEVFIKEKINNDTVITLLPYFHNKKYYWSMGKMKMISYHHTFSEISKKLKECSFYIDEIDESRPPEKSGKINRFDFEFSARYPTFCIFKAFKK